MKIKHLLVLLAALTGGLASVPAANAQDHAHHPAAAATARSFEANISLPSDIKAGEPLAAEIEIRDDLGKAVENFDLFQEKLMHLIVVDSSLGSWQHLHPEYLGNGNFRIDLLLPTPGKYHLFCDFLPSGEREQLAMIEIVTAGATPLVDDAQPLLTTEKFVGDTKVVLTLPAPAVVAGQETVLSFELSHAESLRPIVELQPYLGEKGHLVILRKSSPLTANDYIHAHAAKDGGGSEIRFMTRFPTPGFYKLWCQFNIGGTVQTADFWVR